MPGRPVDAEPRLGGGDLVFLARLDPILAPRLFAGKQQAVGAARPVIHHVEVTVEVGAKAEPNAVTFIEDETRIDRLPLADIEATLLAMRELKMKVVVSELDIDVIPRGRWWQDGGKYREEMSKLDPYREGCPPEILGRQAEQYGQLFRLLRKYSDVVARVSFWDLHDGQSWLNDFPWKRVNHPLLFDGTGRPKPAFDSVIAALQQAPESEQPKLRLEPANSPRKP